MNGSAGTRPLNLHAELPLHDLLAQLSSVELAFFAFLDTQLDKVESFYLGREKEMIARGKMLQEQLNELNDHRKLVLVCFNCHFQRMLIVHHRKIIPNKVGNPH